MTDGGTLNSDKVSVILFGIVSVFAGTEGVGPRLALLPGSALSASIAAF